MKIDNIPIDNWSYRNLRKYLSQNIITSIETQDYSTYKRQRLNTDNAISIDTPVSDSVVTNNNTFNSSGTFLFTVNIYLLTLLFVTVSPIDLSAELSNLAPIQNNNTVLSTIHTSSSQNISIDVNGFDIYQMRHTNLIRVHDDSIYAVIVFVHVMLF